MLTDQGLIEGNAYDTLRFRQQICPRVKIFADVHVKHAVPLGQLCEGIPQRTQSLLFDQLACVTYRKRIRRDVEVAAHIGSLSGVGCEAIGISW